MSGDLWAQVDPPGTGIRHVLTPDDVTALIGTLTALLSVGGAA